MNEKVYIHELVDIRGHSRARYMHHMTANWSPIAQEERHQLCYGVWGVVGSTSDWPQVLNIWEEDGFEGLAASFGHELRHPGLQDPKLAKWWAEAANYRRGGRDRILVPAPWTLTIEELCAEGVRGEVYAHEQTQVRQGGSHEYLEHVRRTAVPLYEQHGWVLVGAWETAMSNESECIFLWAISSWDGWAALERAERADSPLGRWRRASYERTISSRRFLVVDSPLSPLRLGRQPARSDRSDDWTDL